MVCCPHWWLTGSVWVTRLQSHQGNGWKMRIMNSLTSTRRSSPRGRVCTTTPSLGPTRRERVNRPNASYSPVANRPQKWATTSSPGPTWRNVVCCPHRWLPGTGEWVCRSNNIYSPGPTRRELVWWPHWQLPISHISPCHCTYPSPRYCTPRTTIVIKYRTNDNYTLPLTIQYELWLLHCIYSLVPRLQLANTIIICLCVIQAGRDSGCLNRRHCEFYVSPPQPLHTWYYTWRYITTNI